MQGECVPAERRVNRRFMLRSFADGCVVFDGRSGDTHALDPLAARVFVSSVAVDIVDLPEAIAQALSPLTRIEWDEAAAQARERLEGLGLLASATPGQ